MSNAISKADATRHNLELDIQKLKSANTELKAILGDLVDIQNGSPLVRDTDKWNKIMKKAYEILGWEG